MAKKIDNVIVDGRPFSDVIDERSFRGPYIDSDHYLVVSEIRALLSAVSDSWNRRSKRFKIQRFSADDTVADYHQELNERISETNESDNLNTLWESINGVNRAIPMIPARYKTSPVYEAIRRPVGCA